MIIILHANPFDILNQMSALHENYKCYDNLLLMGGLLKIKKNVGFYF